MKRLAFPGVIGVAVYFAVAGGEYSFFDVRGAEEELKVRRHELPVVRWQIDSLRARIDSLEHSDPFLERFARESYGFIRDGELLYRLTETEAESEPAEPPRQSLLDRLRASLGSLGGGGSSGDGSSGGGSSGGENNGDSSDGGGSSGDGSDGGARQAGNDWTR